MAGVAQSRKLPRLLDLDESPPLIRLRRYWRYIHRWRRRLYHLWRGQASGELDDAAVARAVDDLMAIFFLVEHLRRKGCHSAPAIQDVCRSASRPSVSNVAGAIAEMFSSPILAAALEPGGFDNDPSIPNLLFLDHWERRIENATWLLYGDRSLPLSFFGNFHQVCVGNPLNVQSTGTDEQCTRRARGMYYTPAPIVDYLVSTTLDRLLAERHPEELLQLRLLDPSCGCGAFLIGCLRYLFRWLGLRLDCGDEEATRAFLTLAGRMFHGCDIDPQAVRWSIRLLLLSAWESLTSRVGRQDSECMLPVPDLREAIRCKSFLDLTPDESDGPSPAGFDVIVGGPPFVRLQQLHQTQHDQLPMYRRRYLSARQGQFDLYMLFIERAIDLLNEGGYLAFSLSNSFLRTISGQTVRGYIAANACVEEIVEFDDPRTYADAATQIVLLRLRKTRRRCGGRHILIKGRRHLRRTLEQLLSDQLTSDISVTALQPEATASSRWRLTTSKDAYWLEKIHEGGVPLGRLVKIEHGPSTGLDRVLLLKQAGRSINGEVFAQARKSKQTFRLEEAAVRFVVRGRQIRGYRPPTLRYLYPFPYDAHGDVLPEQELQTRFPLMYAYLSLYRGELLRRPLPKGCRWYSTFCHPRRCEARGPRLISGRIVSRGSFGLVSDLDVLTHSSVVVLTPRISKVDPYYLLGVLNSRAFGRYVSLTMPMINTGRYSLRLSALRLFPVPDPESQRNHAICRRVASLVHDLLRMSARQAAPSHLASAIEDEVACVSTASTCERPVPEMLSSRDG